MARIRMDFHVHTRYSADSGAGVAAIARVCSARGIGCVAVTDHNTLRGALELRERATVRVVVGEEIATTAGEIIGYFLEEPVRPGLSPADTVRAIREQGGLVCVPHPFDRWRGSALEERALAAILPDVDLIEIFNARNLFPADNRQAAMFARRTGKAGVVGTDAHFPGEVGHCHMLVEDFTGPSDLLEKLPGARIVVRRGRLRWSLASSVVKAGRRMGLGLPPR